VRQSYGTIHKSSIFFLTEEILYSILAVSDQIKGVRPSPYATGVPFLLGRRYQLTRVSVCASQKYFFHIGRKQEMNVD
jgi:hypothetical protein